MRNVYLDHNATTPVHPEVVRAVTECLENTSGNPSSLHRWGREAKALRDRARDEIAEAAGCGPGSVIFTSGGTEADNLAIRGLLRPDRNHVVTVATEHEAVLHTAQHLEEQGTEVTVLPVDGRGLVDPDAVDAALRPGTAVVSVMMANNETGVIQPVREIGALCRARGVPFHTDAVQAFGKVPLQFDDLPVDLVSISSHKIRGPKGIGALLVRDGLPLHPLVTGGGQERSLRPGTENLPGMVGFGRAARLAAEGLPGESARLGKLRDRLEEGLRARIPSVRVNGEGADRLPNTSNVTFPGLDGESLLIALDLEGVAVSTGAACNAGASEPSHVLLAMGRTRAEAGGSIRFSLGSGTEETEIEDVLSILPEIAHRQAASGATG